MHFAPAKISCYIRYIYLLLQKTAFLQKKIGSKNTTINTILLQGRAADIINPTASGPEVVKLEPNVCVVKSKAL